MRKKTNLRKHKNKSNKSNKSTNKNQISCLLFFYVQINSELIIENGIYT